MKKKNLTSLSEFIDKQVGKRGTKEREKFELGYEVYSRQVTSQVSDDINISSQLTKGYKTT